ncbi:MAG TPA: hypothetical protein VF251_13795, partial [Pyrinomonadaceae bacterium]
MKKLRCWASLLLLHLIVSFSVFAQRPADATHTWPPYKKQDELAEERIQKTPNPTASDFSVKSEARVLKKGLLAPSAQDRLDHENFLKQSKTGLIRLLPREVYDWRVYETPKQIEMRGGGAYFSFIHRTHEYGQGSDLELDHNQFSVGFAGADFGMLIRLGNVPLDSIAEDDPRFIYMSTY